MNSPTAILDWTLGTPGIAFQRCTRCHHAWYMRRTFCPRCGANDPLDQQARGVGTVYARTQVTRAPTEALRTHAPYTVALVDCEEGFRVMAHAQADVAIGDTVRLTFIEFGGQVIPKFIKP